MTQSKKQPTKERLEYLNKKQGEMLRDYLALEIPPKKRPNFLIAMLRNLVLSQRQQPMKSNKNL